MKCQIDRMTEFPDAKVPNLSLCQNVKMSKCPSVQMSKCPSVQISKCPNVKERKIYRGQNVKKVLRVENYLTCPPPPLEMIERGEKGMMGGIPPHKIKVKSFSNPESKVKGDLKSSKVSQSLV